MPRLRQILRAAATTMLLNGESQTAVAPVSMVNSINHSYQGLNIRWRIFLVQDYTFSNFKTNWCYMCSSTSTKKTAHYSFWTKPSIRCRGYVKYLQRLLQRCFLMEHPRLQWLHTSECIDQPYLVCMND